MSVLHIFLFCLLCSPPLLCQTQKCIIPGSDFLHDYVNSLVSSLESDLSITIQYGSMFTLKLNTDLPFCYGIMDMPFIAIPHFDSIDDILFTLNKFNFTVWEIFIYSVREILNPESGFCTEPQTSFFNMVIQSLGCWWFKQFPIIDPQNTRRMVSPPQMNGIEEISSYIPIPYSLGTPNKTLYSILWNDTRLNRTYNHLTEDIASLTHIFSFLLFGHDSTQSPPLIPSYSSRIDWEAHLDRTEQRNRSPYIQKRYQNLKNGERGETFSPYNDSNFIYHTKLLGRDIQYMEPSSSSSYSSTYRIIPLEDYLLGFDEPTVTGYAPTDNHIWVLRLIPSIVNIIKHLYWIFLWILRAFPFTSTLGNPLFIAIPELCLEAFPKLPDGIYGCEYIIFQAPTTTALEDLGIDVSSLTCTYQPTLWEYLLDVFDLFNPLSSWVILLCLIGNMVIILPYIAAILLIGITFGILFACLYCCCTIERWIQRTRDDRRKIGEEFTQLDTTVRVQQFQQTTTDKRVDTIAQELENLLAE